MKANKKRSDQVKGEDWDVVKSFFPKNWKWLAKRTKALKGLRKDKNPETLLRVLLMHLGCGYSLRETSVRATQAGIADLTDVALLKRLRKSQEWLHSLCVSLLNETGKNKKRKQERCFRLVDSTVIKEQGKTGSEWKIHYSLEIPSLQCDFFKLTSKSGKGNGDSLLRYPVKSGEYIIADRGYCQFNGIHYVNSIGAFVCVRVNQDGICLAGNNGEKFPLLEKIRALKCTGMIGEWEAAVTDKKKKSVNGRICAIRKSEIAIQLAHKKLRRLSSKNGTTLKPETLEFAKYIILFTTFPRDEFTARDILEGYRFRWQIELIFKRFKQIAQLGHLPKSDQSSVKAWLYGKLFVAIVTQRIIEYADSFSPWGYDLEKIADAKSLA